MANRFFQSWANRRRNPFTDQENPVEKQETGLIIPTSAPYLVQLLEVPLKEMPSSVTIYNVTDSQYMTEVATFPAQGQFRVDYPEPGGEGTGLVEFNSADAGKVINIGYKGTGSPIVTEFLDAIIEDYKPSYPGIMASDTVRNSNDAEKSQASPTGWSKSKEIKLNESMPGSLKVYWEMKSETAQERVQSKLCVNGVQVGEIKESSSTVYQPFSEVITGGINKNDLIQIYVYSPDGAVIYVQNMRFCYDRAIVTIGGYTLVNPLPVEEEYVLDVTNQDPF